MKIQQTGKSDYPQIMDVWKSTVGATHDFLKPAD
jgi:hypothetical protein